MEQQGPRAQRESLAIGFQPQRAAAPACPWGLLCSKKVVRTPADMEREAWRNGASASSTVLPPWGRTHHRQDQTWLPHLPGSPLHPHSVLCSAQLPPPFLQRCALVLTWQHPDIPPPAEGSHGPEPPQLASQPQKPDFHSRHSCHIPLPGKSKSVLWGHCLGATNGSPNLSLFSMIRLVTKTPTMHWPWDRPVPCSGQRLARCLTVG